MDNLNSYPKIYNVGHKAISTLFEGSVLLEEKVDGSQFSFGKFNDKLECRSKNCQIDVDNPNSMFIEAVETVKHILPALHEGWVYRGEYLRKPKHNALAYSRTPQNFIMIFDVNTGLESYLGYEDKVKEAGRLGFECVPKLFEGKVVGLASLVDLLNVESVLGGQNVEGVVVKSYEKFGRDGKALMGKHVSEAFKEAHKVGWRKENPTGGDIVEMLSTAYATEARWDKAIQHLKESGELEWSPKDIGRLVVEIKKDVREECTQTIKDSLFAWAWPKISRNLTRGFPEFYKEKLLASAFDEGA